MAKTYYPEMMRTAQALANIIGGHRTAIVNRGNMSPTDAAALDAFYGALTTFLAYFPAYQEPA